MDAPICTLEELRTETERLKREGKRVVALSGSFDLLHAGHIAYLEAARAKGDALVVLLNSDRSIRLYKGPRRPIVTESDRARVLAALRAVDYVTLFDDLTPVPALEAFHPDIYVNGADWGEECIERDIVERHGGKIEIIPLKDKVNQSTSMLVKRITEASGLPANRAVFVNRDAIAPESLEAAKRLRENGYLVFVLGIPDGADAQELRKRFEEGGAPLAGPLGPIAANLESILAAAAEHDLVLAESWLVGPDIGAGRSANMKVFAGDDLAAAAAHILGNG